MGHHDREGETSLDRLGYGLAAICRSGFGSCVFSGYGHQSGFVTGAGGSCYGCCAIVASCGVEIAAEIQSEQLTLSAADSSVCAPLTALCVAVSVGHQPGTRTAALSAQSELRSGFAPWSAPWRVLPRKRSSAGSFPSVHVQNWGSRPLSPAPQPGAPSA